MPNEYSIVVHLSATAGDALQQMAKAVEKTPHDVCAGLILDALHIFVSGRLSGIQCGGETALDAINKFHKEKKIP